MKKNMKARTKKRAARFVVGYMGAGNLLYGKTEFNAMALDIWVDGDGKRTVQTNYPLTRNQARSVLKQMPCADCAVFELVPVEVNR